MKTYPFWSKGTAESRTLDGRDVEFSCWRPSDLSEAAAHESAMAAAKRVLDALLSGRKPDHYDYGCVPLREEVTNQLKGSQGNLVALVTRNLYGSLILNTERVMFVDIDFPAMSAGKAASHFFARLLGRTKKSATAEQEEKARANLEQFALSNSSWGLHVYRTFAGLRAIATHDIFDPKSPATLEVLKKMGCDPLYIRLCKAQECFRARLTPKPWRCGHYANTIKYPLEGEKATQQYEGWKVKYDTCQRSYATCQFLGHIGSDHVHPEAAQVLELHDFATRCKEPLPLA